MKKREIDYKINLTNSSNFHSIKYINLDLYTVQRLRLTVNFVYIIFVGPTFRSKK